MYGIYDLKRRKLDFQAVEYTCFETPEILALYDGTAGSRFAEFVENGDFDADWMSAFAGPFQLILYEKKSEELLISQHLFGNGKNLYYSIHEDILYFASSLHEVKHVVKQPFRLNTPMLPHFFYNGFLGSSHTLIAGVYKLEAATCYIVNETGIHKKRLELKQAQTEEEAGIPGGALEAKYQDALNDCMQALGALTDRPVGIALSGGFDSNCLLYDYKRKFPQKTVHAFSVGGSRGIDETKAASAIAAQYQNVVFHTSLVTPETLEHLDEIVAVLEGAVYERGIFLQYELARLVQKHHTQYLICGECADQVFHSNTYKKIPEDTFLYGYTETPLQMAAYAVLKKSRMMMDAFGIKAVYPFLSPGMVRVGFLSRTINGTTKEFHKRQCRNMLPETVMAYVEKKGGSTDLSALFPEGLDCELEVRNCKYYSGDFMLTKKFDGGESLRDYYLSLLFLESFEKQFCD